MIIEATFRCDKITTFQIRHAWQALFFVQQSFIGVFIFKTTQAHDMLWSIEKQVALTEKTCSRGLTSIVTLFRDRSRGYQVLEESTAYVRSQERQLNWTNPLVSAFGDTLLQDDCVYLFFCQGSSDISYASDISSTETSVTSGECIHSFIHPLKTRFSSLIAQLNKWLLKSSLIKNCWWKTAKITEMFLNSNLLGYYKCANNWIMCHEDSKDLT